MTGLARSDTGGLPHIEFAFDRLKRTVGSFTDHQHSIRLDVYECLNDLAGPMYFDLGDCRLIVQSEVQSRVAGGEITGGGFYRRKLMIADRKSVV